MGYYSAEEIAWIVMGFIGNILALVMFLIPGFTTVRHIWTSRSVGTTTPAAYLVTLMYCMNWALYGFPMVRPRSEFILWVNVVGCVLQLIYIGIYFYFTQTGRKKLVACLLLELFYFATLVVITFLIGPTNASRTRIVAVACLTSNIMVYVAELLIIRLAIQTHSVVKMPLYVSVIFLARCVVWFIYGYLVIFDEILMIVYGIGTVVGVLELVAHVYIYYF